MLYDIAVIGAGAAGMTAALYALRANKSVLLLESTTYGGQILESPLVENYPALANVSGIQFSQNLHQQLQSLGLKITYQSVTNLSVQTTNQTDFYQIHTKKQTFLAKTVILATGTISRKLNLALEDQLIGKGIAFCATCDGSLYQNQDVAVVGGGNSAVLSALHLSELCRNVFLIHRRSVFRAEELLLQKLQKHPNIHLILNNEIIALSSTNGRLSALSLKNPLFPSSDNSSNSYHISSLHDPQGSILKVQALFVEIGRIFPSTALLQELISHYHLQTDPSGFIITDHNCRTNLPGFFAAGDCRSKDLRQLVTATADGALSATAAIEFLS